MFTRLLLRRTLLQHIFIEHGALSNLIKPKHLQLHKIFYMIIAEIAQAHDGSLGIAHSYIDALAAAGVDAIKFQMHIAAAESSVHEPFRVPLHYQDATRFDYWKRMEFTPGQWRGLKKHCEEKNLEFICSPFSNAAVDILETLEIKKYKIGSGEITNHLLLEKIAATKKPVLLSSGLSTWKELDDAVEIFTSKNIECAVMQCTSVYPAAPEQWGLNIIAQIKQRYNTIVGYSDHSGDIYACLAAAALGAEIFEFHAAFDKKMYGPDSTSSITVNEIKKLTGGIRQIQNALQHPVEKNNIQNLQSLKNMFEKSLALNQSLTKGTVIVFEHLEGKKPKGCGIAAEDYKQIIGKKLSFDKLQWDFLEERDID